MRVEQAELAKYRTSLARRQMKVNINLANSFPQLKAPTTFSQASFVARSGLLVLQSPVSSMSAILRPLGIIYNSATSSMSFR